LLLAAKRRGRVPEWRTIQPPFFGIDGDIGGLELLLIRRTNENHVERPGLRSAS